MAFPSELDAFRAFAKSSPKNCVLLLDTYDVRQGIKNAITVAKEMEQAGERLAAIRIDSGDLARLSKQTRAAFDEAGLPYVKISVSNDLDEYTIQSLFAQGAPIDSFGVGTKLATCDPQPSLGGVYKLSAIRGGSTEPWTPVIKLSEQAYKRTIPGVQRVLRYYDDAGCPHGRHDLPRGPARGGRLAHDRHPRPVLRPTSSPAPRWSFWSAWSSTDAAPRSRTASRPPATAARAPSCGSTRPWPASSTRRPTQSAWRAAWRRLRHDLAHEERAGSSRPTVG